MATTQTKRVAQAAGAQPFADHRRLLETNGLDAVLIATPDHWHKAIAIDALNAGKDVYVEKPLTRLREEGPEIVRAARVNNRVCQVGMQQRSGEVYLEARERFVQSGMLGKISHVDCVWHSGANRALPTEPAQKPANLDWVRFLGAAEIPRLESGAISRFPRVSGFRRREAHRFRRALDRRGRICSWDRNRA